MSNICTRIGEKTYYFGLKEPTSKEIASFSIARLFKATSEKLPDKVDLLCTYAIPNPGDQGEQGSCTAWATAYADKTFLEKMERNHDFEWDVTITNYQFSPAYIYNQINGGVDEGSTIPDALNIMINQGVCTLADMPYNDKDYSTQPNEVQRSIASKYKSKSWVFIPELNNVNTFKSYLANKRAVIIGIPVYQSFWEVTEDKPYDDTSGMLYGYHAICLVGYDESKKIFKYINSWGKNYGINGFGNITYNFISKQKIQGYVMEDLSNHYNKLMITDLKIIEDNEAAPDEYEKVQMDLNKGTGGENIYLCYKKEEKPGKFIDDIILINGDETIPEGYKKLSKNLSEGSIGKGIYLCYKTTSDEKSTPITDINVTNNQDFANSRDGYIRVQQDVNTGVGDKYMYLFYQPLYTTPITDIVILASTKENMNTPKGYIKVNLDLNEKTSGDSIYLFYKKDFINEPISDIVISYGDSVSVPIPENYQKIDMDLNLGANGKNIYLFYKRSYDTPLTQITALRNDEITPDGFKKINVDLNTGAGGDNVYLCYLQQ